MFHQSNLYYLYPSEKLDHYLYGPLFSIIISPFSLFPINVGAFLWCIVNAAILFLAIRQLPVGYKNQNIILLISTIEMMTCIQNMQINCIVVALIILSFTFIHTKRDIWATFLIAIGFLIKLYGIVGIAFLFFSKKKVKFILSFLFWLVVLFLLPIFISSTSFIFHSYIDWYHTLIIKNNVNAHSGMQNISVMGMLSQISKAQYLNLSIIFIAALLYLFPLLRIHQLKNPVFQLSYVSLVLIGVVIFSSSAESPTYIIAVVGVGLWFVLQDEKHWPVIFLLIFTIIFTSLSSTDFFPKYVRLNFIQPYKLKALPCFLVWIILVFQLMKKDFQNKGIAYEAQLRPAKNNY
ncbi:MAG: DUF2029 domain-containing protein [Bacteroidota bacterium]|nr:DUF2029 domain-containing protein [Bacteroidota bacterium]